MKQSVILLHLLVLISAGTAFSQTGEGNKMIGGTADFGVRFNAFNNALNFNLHPGFGYFLADEFVVGAHLDIGFGNSERITSASFGVIPFARYYIGTGRSTMVFLQTKAGFSTTTVADDISTNTSGGSVYGAGGGLTVFLNEHIAVEGLLELLRHNINLGFTDLGFRFGVQAYLDSGASEDDR